MINNLPDQPMTCVIGPPEQAAVAPGGGRGDLPAEHHTLTAPVAKTSNDALK